MGCIVQYLLLGSAIIEKALSRYGAHSRLSLTEQLETNLVRSCGVIALTSSIAPNEGHLRQRVYAASKERIKAMVFPAAHELARHGIRVLGVAPSVFDTPFTVVLSDEVKTCSGAAVLFPQGLGQAKLFAST